MISFYGEENSDIVFAELTHNLRIDLAMAIEIVDLRLRFTKNRKHFLVADVSNVRHISAEAKEYFQKADGGMKNILGAAFIASNPVSALIASIFIKTPKAFHAKFFSNREAAFDWIFEYRKRQSTFQKP